MKIRFNVYGFIDRRSLDLHARHDVIEQERFRLRVARNLKERARLERQRARNTPAVEALPSILRRQFG